MQISSKLIPCLLIALSFSACTFFQKNQVDIQVATNLAVGEAILSGKTPAEEKIIADNIILVVTAIQGTLNGDKTTVASLVALVQAKIFQLKLNPQEALAAQTLMTFVSSELEAKMGTGVLNAADLVVVNDFATWVKADAMPYG